MEVLDALNVWTIMVLILTLHAQILIKLLIVYKAIEICSIIYFVKNVKPHIIFQMEDVFWSLAYIVIVYEVLYLI